VFSICIELCVCVSVTLSVSGITIQTTDRSYYFRPATVQAMWSVRHTLFLFLDQELISYRYSSCC